MATFDDLFGKKSGDKKYMKWNAVGDTIIVQLLGEPYQTPQKEFKTGKKKFMVETTEKKPDGKSKFTVLTEDKFDPEALEEKGLRFWALTQIAVEVRVVAYKNANGEADPNHEPFETTWELNPEQEEKLKEAMMEDRSLQVGAGTIGGIKWIGGDKPRKYAIKLKAGE